TAPRTSGARPRSRRYPQRRSQGGVQIAVGSSFSSRCSSVQSVLLGPRRVVGQLQTFVAVAAVAVGTNRPRAGTDVLGVEVVLVAGVLGEANARIPADPRPRERDRTGVVLRVRDRHVNTEVVVVGARPPLDHV